MKHACASVNAFYEESRRAIMTPKIFVYLYSRLLLPSSNLIPCAVSDFQRIFLFTKFVFINHVLNKSVEFNTAVKM